MQLVSAPGGISAHDASFHPILSLVLAILRLISDNRCFYKYVYIYIYISLSLSLSNATGICPRWHFSTIYPPLHISMLPRSHTSTKAQKDYPKVLYKKKWRAPVFPLGGGNPAPAPLWGCASAVQDSTS